MSRARGARAGLCVGLLGLLPGSDPLPTAAARVEEGNALWAAGDPAGALERYEAAERLVPGRPEIAFDRATALVRLGRHDAALEAYMAALGGEDAGLRSAARYGIGVIHLERALDPSSAKGEAGWQARAAIRYLRESLELDRSRVDARHNLELAHRLLRALEAERGQPEPRGDLPDNRLTHRRGQALQDLVQDQAGEQNAPADQLQDHRPQASDQTPENFSARPPEGRRNDRNLPVAMDPRAAAELIEKLLESMRRDQAWRTEMRRAALREPGEREPW